jgi:mono/diheme cytochrome c family protein
LRDRLISDRIRLLGVVLAAAVLGPSFGSADPGAELPPNPALVSRGAQHYARYCASCHGTGGRGDGAVAAALRTPPADLTKVAARRQGTFPAGELRAYIDGRLATAAHGTREMPVWGETFREEIPDTQLREEFVRGRLYTLVYYLQSIQDPPALKAE